MNEDYISKHKLFFYLAFIIIGLITFYPFFTTGFGNADDLHNYLVTQKGDYFGNAKLLAYIAGRFYFYLVLPVHNLTYINDNMVITKFFQIVPIVLCILLFARILFVMTRSKELSLLFVLLFLVLTQVSGHTSLYVTYPLFFTFSFALLLISFLLLFHYLESKKKKLIIYSTIFFTIGLLFYEIYLLYIVLLFFTILIYYLREKKDIKQVVKETFLLLTPYISVSLIYVVIYFVFRI